MSTPKEWTDYYQKALDIANRLNIESINLNDMKIIAGSLADIHNKAFDDAVVELGRLRRK